MLLLAVSPAASWPGQRRRVLGFTCGLLVDLLFLETPSGCRRMVFTVVGYGVGTLQAGCCARRGGFPFITAARGLAPPAIGLFALVGAMLGEREPGHRPPALVAVVVGVLNAVSSPSSVVPLMRRALDASTELGVFA